MREMLIYPQIDEQKIERVKDLIGRIAELPHKDDAREALSELNRLSGKNYDEMAFVEYWGWTDLDTLARKVMLQEPPCVGDLEKGEMEAIVSIIKRCLQSLDDNQAEYYMELLHKSLPLTNVEDYILSGKNVTAIVDDMIEASKKSIVYL